MRILANLFTPSAAALFALLLCSRVAIAQNWNLIYARELEAEELMMDHQFQRAAEKYIQARELIPENYNLAFKIGYCYLQTDTHRDLAYRYMREAAQHVSPDHDPRSLQEMAAPPVAHFFLGRIYQVRGEFDQAIASFNRFLELVGPEHPMSALAKQQVAASQWAPELMANAQHVIFHNLGGAINTDQPNFNAVVSGNGRVMAYTTLARIGFDVHVSYLGVNGWEAPRRITNDLGGRFFKTAALSYDGAELLLVEDAGRGLDILVAVRQDDRQWSQAQRLRRPINSRYNEAHASLSADGNTIYFTSDRPGGLGGLDIYSTSLDERGRWAEPRNLGPAINTPLNEHTPFITQDHVLFFSSEGHRGLGGYDIFHVDLNANLTPQNLGYPINTPDDNLFFFPETTRSGYLAHVQPGSVGGRDIHHVRIVPTVNLMAHITGGGSEAVRVAVYEQGQLTPLAQAQAQAMGQTLIHRLPPGHYRLSIASPNFEAFNTSFHIPDDYSGSEFAVRAQLRPAAPPAQPVATTPPPPVQPEELGLALAATPAPPQRAAAPAPAPRAQPAAVAPAATPGQRESGRTARPRGVPAGDVGVSSRYTVQVMALQTPVSPLRFHAVENLIVVSGDDGFYRYSSGIFASAGQAQAMLARLVAEGYRDAFVRPLPVAGAYSVQVMALRLPRSPGAFQELADLIIVQGADSIYRYSSGAYPTPEQAQERLSRVVAQGYRDAFVQRIFP